MMVIVIDLKYCTIVTDDINFGEEIILTGNVYSQNNKITRNQE